MTHFILYSRSYCHLCDDMLHALQAFHVQYEFVVEVVDVDADAALTAQYDELVPVLIGVKKLAMEHAGTTQLCHYFLDAVKVKKFLEMEK